MKKNLSRLDARIRMITGFLLFYFFILGGPVWMATGLYLMLSSSFGFCLFYYLLKPKDPQ